MSLAITDLIILTDDTSEPPHGWKKHPTDLNEGAQGAYLFLAYYRDPDRQSPENWITEIDVLKGPAASIDQQWTTVKDKAAVPVNLNKDTPKKGATELYLVYKKGGSLRPIVGLSVVKSLKEFPAGYEVIPQDLNESAGGADLFIAFLRKNRTLTIGKLTCISPSSGYGGLAKAAVNTALSAAGAAIGTVAGVVVGSATGPGAVAIVIGAGVGGAAAGTALGEAIHAVATEFGTGTKDDVSIRINGTKAWPYSRDGRHEMKSDDSIDVDFVSPFQDDLKVSIMEKDWLLWTVDTDKVTDVLGEMLFTTQAGQTGTYMFFNTDEGSTYAVDIIIDNTSPQLKITNNRTADVEVIDGSNKVVARLKPNMSKLMPTVPGETWKLCVNGDFSNPVGTYKATNEPDQYLVTPTPTVLITNRTRERIYIYDPSHRRETASLAPASSTELDTFPGEVWSILGESDRVYTYTASDEVKQMVEVTLPYLQVNNKLDVPVSIRSSYRRNWFELTAASASEFWATGAGEIWTFRLADDKAEKYIATDAAEQVITIDQNRLKVERAG